MEKGKNKSVDMFAGCSFIWIGSLGFLFQDLQVSFASWALIILGGIFTLLGAIGKGPKFTRRPSEGIIALQFILGGALLTLFTISVTQSLLYPSSGWTLLIGLAWWVLGTRSLTVRLCWTQPPP